MPPLSGQNQIDEFFITGADATACIKSTCFNMAKAGYTVCVFSDCVTSYDLKKLGEMFAHYESKGCTVKELRVKKGNDMKDFFDFFTAALPWLCTGLLLAVFFAKSFRHATDG